MAYCFRRKDGRGYAIIPPMFPPLLAIAPQLSGQSRAALNFLAIHGGLIVCALFLLVGLATAGDYGRGLDAGNQRQTAVGNLDYVLGQADRIESFNDHDRLYGVAFELPLLLAEGGLEDLYYVNRLRLTLTHLFFIIGGFFCYRLAYRLFGSRRLALIALLIFLLHPRIYAHSFVNSKDLPFLSMFVIALYLLERAFRRDTLGAFVLLGIAVGLLTNLRIMGIMLFPAIIALRGLDLFYAGGGPERKHILLTAGGFLLAAGLTLYAVTPYAWANPVDYLAASLNLTANHPTIVRELFQGEWFLSDQLPPHYNAVWFAITTPLLMLLLGSLGIALAGARGFRRPGAALRNNRRRLQLLLPACFLLPPLAAALLGSNQNNDWRHFYFLYVPFGLLAAGGLGWLAHSFSRQRPWRAGLYGLAVSGLGLTLLQMAQLHPVSYLYFNALVNRDTPEYLRMQYLLSHSPLTRPAALQYLLKSHPGETLALHTRRLTDFELRPPADRERLQPAGGGRRADYVLLDIFPTQQPDLAFNTVFGRVYNNTTNTALRPLDSARMTPAAVAAYQEIYRQAVAGEPVVRADYDVYRNGNRLTFVRENCPPDSRGDWFSAQPLPPDPEIRPAAAGSRGDYTDPRLGNYGVQLGDRCLAVIQLPAATRGDLLLSQRRLEQGWPAEPPLWWEIYSITPPPLDLQDKIARRRQEPPPAGPDAFAVFLEPDAGGSYRLLYTKGDCAPEDYKTRPFLHIRPENLADLPFYLWESGVDNREFAFTRYGVRLGGECLAVYPLPEYPIASILTGQAGIWETRLYPPADPEPLRAAYAALANIQPNTRSNFDLYVQDNQLIYFRESCAAADTAAGFFLHIIPEGTSDLPADRRDAGFAHAGFDFARQGGHFDGKCLAVIPLPEYPIREIRTGQHIPSQGDLWSVELIAAPDYDQLRADYAALSATQPAARDVFDLYLRNNRLIYLRENCAAEDTAAGFFLHIVPVDVTDLPADRRPAGFAHGGFNFVRQGGHFDGKCLAAVALPDYPIKEIRTGQYVPGQGDLWSVELTVGR